MKKEEFILKAMRKIYRKASQIIGGRIDDKGQGSQYYGYVQLFDQDANDFY